MNTIYYVFGSILVLFLFWLVFLTLKYKQLIKKAEILFDIKKPKNLASLVLDYQKDVQRVEDYAVKLESKLKKVSSIAVSGLHKVGFVRYNPFGNVGGDQSFSLCLLDGKNNGFVMSSIHSREGTRVYSKTISGGESIYNLSEEEKRAIKIALGERK